VRKLEKDFDALELQHVPRDINSAADDLSARASTWAPVPEGVFDRQLLKPTTQPAKLGEGGQTRTSKLAVPVVLHPWSPLRIVCATEDPGHLSTPRPVAQWSPDAWISEIRDYLKDNILPEEHMSAERIVRLAKRYVVVEGYLYRRGANGILMLCITRRRATSCSRRSMEASAEVISHPVRWLVKPFGMDFTGQPHSRMQLS